MLVQKKWLARLTAASLLLGLVAQNAQSDNGDSVNVDVVLAVVNESEALLEARIDVISEAYGLDISRTKSGHYAVRGTHRWHARSERDRTFLIEIKVSGYKPRVLEFGRDFQAKEDHLCVVLQEGPFERRESVFSSVTGRPPTDEEVAKMPHARRVRLRESEYRRVAAEGHVCPEELPPKPKEHGISLQGRHYPPPPECGSLIPVMARSLEGVAGLPCVAAVDGRGSPVDRIFVQWAMHMGPDRVTGVPRGVLFKDAPVRTLSSPDGKFRVPNNCVIWSEGTEQVFVPAPYSDDPGLREVILPLSRESKGKWVARRRLGQGEDRPKASRAEIREITEDLEDSPGLNGSAREERFHKALEQARMYRVTQAARTIRTLLLKWEFKGDFDFWYTDELVATLVDIQGDGAIRFLEQTASDTTVNPLARRSAVIGLGRIGSERSVAAFERLRDAARSLPEAPQAQESYTHQERICEAVEMVCIWIPGVDPKSRVAFQPIARTASVSGDYITASVHCGSPFELTEVELKRFGDEWLVIEIGGTLCF